MPDNYIRISHKFEKIFLLQKREGKRRTSYRYRFTRDGELISGTLYLDPQAGIKTDADAAREAEKLIQKERFGEKPKPKSLIRCEVLCDEIVELKKSKDAATYEQAEIFMRIHLKPWLNEHCPYAANLNATVWLQYKNDFRLKHPDSPLFNHWKFFVQLFGYAFQKGIVQTRVKLEYNEKKEDNRKAGLLISDEHFKAYMACANRNWRDRGALQRLTGQRPGVIRMLRKDQVNLDTGVVKVLAGDSKNNRNYEFVLPDACIRILKGRLELERVKDSPYFFPNERNHTKAMDKNLNGWNAAWLAAKLEGAGYTPHDLRHTFLTEKFQNSPNPALVCYQCDLSLEEAMRTYIHFKAEDTRAIALGSEAKALELLGGATV